ncbi:MAG: HK97 family phage prohead protease [Bacteroides sp.]|nr:HK97 family phage prohead protease [Bacteroides sp.]MCM1448284.1 HK97 family phage prohead protease [Bacteroides sp.]
MSKRISFTPTGLHVREAGENEGDSRIIEGCGIVFDKETVLYENGNYRESEIIRRSCITEEFLLEQDIKLNLLHNRLSSMARRRRGEGALNLEVREDGLYFTFEAPKCDLGDRALALIRNGTYTGCSFEFYSKDYEVTKRGENDYLITHTAFERLTAITIAMDPAYEQTSVNAREEWEKGHPKELRTATEEEEEGRTEDRGREKRGRKARYYATL